LISGEIEIVRGPLEIFGDTEASRKDNSVLQLGVWVSLVGRLLEILDPAWQVNGNASVREKGHAEVILDIAIALVGCILEELRLEYRIRRNDIAGEEDDAVPHPGVRIALSGRAREEVGGEGSILGNYAAVPEHATVMDELSIRIAVVREGFQTPGLFGSGHARFCELSLIPSSKSCRQQN
jgi:hypothetical protein